MLQSLYPDLSSWEKSGGEFGDCLGGDGFKGLVRQGNGYLVAIYGTLDALLSKCSMEKFEG